MGAARPIGQEIAMPCLVPPKSWPAKITDEGGID
jgi:hypothetical protein